jgi:carbonic anhydrase/acetyltransferase-like protein (isoleucine patch superfamily)
MPLIQSVRGFTPAIGKDCFIAENATIVGDVILGDECSVWFSAVVRGDVNSIRTGNRVNIQDGAVLHCTYEKSKTILGNNVSIGHNAVVHGCTIHDNVLIGMGAIVMDLAVIESNVIVAAGAVVPENQILESGYIYAGVPARKLKPIDPANTDFFIRRTAENYVNYANWFLTKK